MRGRSVSYSAEMDIALLFLFLRGIFGIRKCLLFVAQNVFWQIFYPKIRYPGEVHPLYPENQRLSR